MALINTTTTGVLGSTFYADGSGDLTIQQNGALVNKITSNGFTVHRPGTVLQVVSAKCGNGTSTARIPVDNTTPTNTEGVQIWTASITPTSSSNTVLVYGACQASGDANSLYYQFALFRGSTCIGAWQAENSWSNAGVMLTICVMDSPATTSSTTYSVRASTNSNTLYYGSVFNNNFGNIGENYYILQEIAA